MEAATRDEARVIPVPGMNGARMMASISSVEMRGPCRVLVWLPFRVLAVAEISHRYLGLAARRMANPRVSSVSRHLGVSMVADRSDQRPILRSRRETCGELLCLRQHRTHGRSGRDLPSLWGSALPRASGRRPPQFQAPGPRKAWVHPPPAWRSHGPSPGNRRCPANRQGQAVQRAREREPLTATTTSPPAVRQVDNQRWRCGDVSDVLPRCCGVSCTVMHQGSTRSADCRRIRTSQGALVLTQSVMPSVLSTAARFCGYGLR